MQSAEAFAGDGRAKLEGGDGSRGASGKGILMSRLYEVMFIVRPDVVDEDVDKMITSFSNAVTNGGGAVKSVEKMGRRKLAYTVRKFNDGNYLLFTIESDGKQISELERRLRVSEPVIKFITVRTDEEEKRLAKVKALRRSRVKKSAEPVAHAAPTPAAHAAVTPAAPVAAAPAAPVAPVPVAAAADAPAAPVADAPAAPVAATPATPAADAPAAPVADAVQPGA
jgi:small subunit ribosomal protein S6